MEPYCPLQLNQFTDFLFILVFCMMHEVKMNVVFIVTDK